MAEWSQRTAEYVEKQVNGWLAEYFEENYQQSIKPDPGKDTITFFVELFAEKMYDNHQKTPKTWTAWATEDIITGYFPAKVVIEEGDANFVIPSIASFVNFLGDKGYIRNAKTIEKAVYDAEEAFHEERQSPENFGFAKQLAMKALEEAVDFSNEEEVRQFIDVENAAIAKQDPYEDNGFFSWAFDETPTESQQRKARNKLNKKLGKKTKSKKKRRK